MSVGFTMTWRHHTLKILHCDWLTTTWMTFVLRVPVSILSLCVAGQGKDRRSSLLPSEFRKETSKSQINVHSFIGWAGYHVSATSDS